MTSEGNRWGLNVTSDLQELSQEKQRTLELLGVKEQEEKSKEMTEESPADGSEGPVDVDLLQDLRHIEEQMKVLLKEKEQADVM